MCTTFLAYKIVDLLKKQETEFLDFPKLIRFNPNIPWKTRGNGAVSLKIKTNHPSKIKNQIKNLVSKYSDTKNGANPGLVFFESELIPSEFTKFSNLALWQLINRSNAKKFVKKNYQKYDLIFLQSFKKIDPSISMFKYLFISVSLSTTGCL